MWINRVCALLVLLSFLAHHTPPLVSEHPVEHVCATTEHAVGEDDSDCRAIPLVVATPVPHAVIVRVPEAGVATPCGSVRSGLTPEELCVARN